MMFKETPIEKHNKKTSILILNIVTKYNKKLKLKPLKSIMNSSKRVSEVIEKRPLKNINKFYLVINLRCVIVPLH